MSYLHKTLQGALDFLNFLKVSLRTGSRRVGNLGCDRSLKASLRAQWWMPIPRDSFWVTWSEYMASPTRIVSDILLERMELQV